MGWLHHSGCRHPPKARLMQTGESEQVSEGLGVSTDNCPTLQHLASSYFLTPCKPHCLRGGEAHAFL